MDDGRRLKNQCLLRFSVSVRFRQCLSVSKLLPTLSDSLLQEAAL